MGWGRYKDPLVPNCQIERDSTNESRALITCNAKKILGDMTLTGERPVKMVVEEGKVYILDDGGNSEAVVNDVKMYVKKSLRPI